MDKYTIEMDLETGYYIADYTNNGDGLNAEHLLFVIAASVEALNEKYGIEVSQVVDMLTSVVEEEDKPSLN